MSDRSLDLINNAIRIVLYSRYQIVRESLKHLIDSNAGLEVIATFSFDDVPRDDDDQPNPDVAVIYLSPGDRIEIIRELLERFPNIKIVVAVDGTDLETQAAALKEGAVGIVQKDQNPKLLIEAIRQTHHGETWLNQVLLNRLLEKRGSQAKKAFKSWEQLTTDSLTARELDVIKMIGEGLKNKNIAERLSISEATVRHHLSSIYGKIGVEDRLNLIIFAYQKGLVQITDELHEPPS